MPDLTLETLNAIRQHALFQAVLTAVLVATMGDRKAFRNFQSVQEAAQYQWGVAAWGVFKAIVIAFGAYYGVGF